MSAAMLNPCELNLFLDNYDNMKRLKEECGWRWASLAFWLKCETDCDFSPEETEKLYALSYMIRKVKGESWRWEKDEGCSVRNG